MENHKLEIFYTIVPILALIVVAIPITKSLEVIEHSPEVPAGVKELEINVIGQQYNWNYQYPGFANGDNLFTISRDAYGEQRPVVLVKGWTTHMFFSSYDVQHAWAVPSFGVKKDCYPVIQNYAWFTPNKSGKFEGQCYELCGPDHGKMVISAIVLEDENDFYRWIAFQHNADEAAGIVDGLRGLKADETLTPIARSGQQLLGEKRFR